jgi:acylphosphatase
MIRRADIRVIGIVQGVNFRYATKRKADELGLSGTVRNMLDGSVHIACEGDEKNVTRLVEWCKLGPPGARVDRVDTEWMESSSHHYTGFSITY